MSKLNQKSTIAQKAKQGLQYLAILALLLSGAGYNI
jgi:hypothetical protein